jgi:crotonobetainyl-CoA:carnitine CoA-transferase CaiB-like acyl-CoA transferase
MEGVGLDYKSLQAINPRLIYAEISGYGKQGPWKDKPGQDLLLQSMSGLAYTTGNGDKDPMPFGLSISDMLCGAQLVQGILAALIRRHKTGSGANISISLMETLLDFQFELLTTYYNSGQLPQRSAINNGHPLLSAPYGIYRTAKGFLAIAMTDLAVLAGALDCEGLRQFTAEDAFAARDHIKAIIAAHVRTQSAVSWLKKLQAHQVWAMEVYNWQQMTELEAYQCLEMEQTIRTKAGTSIRTTRCPIRINGEKLFSPAPAPGLGEHNASIYKELINKS